MRDSRKVWLLAAALLVMALSCSLVSADVRDAEITGANNKRIFLDYFGFKPNEGRLELNVSNISFSSPPAGHHLNLSQIGFFLSHRNLTTDVHYLNRMYLESRFNSCALHSDFSTIIYTFDNLHNKTNFDLLLADTGGHVYNLWFENCLSEHDFNISMNVRSAMYNLEPGSGSPSYLSATKLALPTIYSLFLFTYLCLASFWVYVLYKKSEFSCRIHFIMLVVMMLKCVSIFLELEYESYIQHTGLSQCWYSIVLQFTSGLLDATPLVVLMLLILCGWSYMKPHLKLADKILMGLVILVGLVINYLKVIVYDTRGHTATSCYICDGAASVNNLVWSVFFLFFAITSSAEFLNEARRAHGKASMAYEKITQMRTSLCAYVMLVLVTIFVVAGLDSFCPTPRYQWLSIVLKEASIFTFYVFIMYNSWPKEHNILISDDTEKAASKAFSSPGIQQLLT